ncbi:hypothetical protein I545_2973 [Mycobacterium kansasii 662]|uniref:Uncharacterized protein n=1 Tax=Mycobacterium kansasii 662 TaxID=1299326 RepID=X7ZJS8_MYCKA|nr:hypothetical protein I545_2973 [Mycobacterium kansasii 662]
MSAAAARKFFAVLLGFRRGMSHPIKMEAAGQFACTACGVSG